METLASEVQGLHTGAPAQGRSGEGVTDELRHEVAELRAARVGVVGVLERLREYVLKMLGEKIRP